MKVRNKNTGEIFEYDSFGFRKGLSNGWEDFVPNAESLAELNADWEDCPQQEPNYRSEYIACYCPECHKEIILKVYVKRSTPIINFAEACEEEKKC